MDATPTPKTVLGPQPLAGKTVVVVGGSAGMGYATAASSLRRGARVVLISRDSAKLEKARAALAALYGAENLSCQAVQSTEETVQVYWNTVEKNSVHHLVVTCGGSAGADNFSEISLVDAHRQFSLKYDVQFLHARYGSPKLAAGGSITLFSGVLSRRPGKGSAVLASVNAAIEALTRGLACDLGPRLRVNCISPGLTRISVFTEAGMDKAAQEKMFAGFGSTLPTKRVADADDIGEATVGIITNNIITGIVLDVDGGALLR
jgi:NAD(P)-dependent dehydrogenase (short-subunit alcohol dehydrogenase family)